MDLGPDWNKMVKEAGKKVRVEVDWDLEEDGTILEHDQASVPRLVDIPFSVAEEDWADWLSSEYGWSVLSVERVPGGRKHRGPGIP